MKKVKRVVRWILARELRRITDKQQERTLQMIGRLSRTSFVR